MKQKVGTPFLCFAIQLEQAYHDSITNDRKTFASENLPLSGGADGTNRRNFDSVYKLRSVSL